MTTSTLARKESDHAAGRDRACARPDARFPTGLEHRTGWNLDCRHPSLTTPNAAAALTDKEKTMPVQFEQPTHEVLTLDEVAEYLRLPKDRERQAMRGQLPARRIETPGAFSR